MAKIILIILGLILIVILIFWWLLRTAFNVKNEKDEYSSSNIIEDIADEFVDDWI